MVRSILEEDEDNKPLAFVNSMSPDMPIEEAVKKLNAFLRVNNTPSQVGSVIKKLKFSDLRTRIEDKGVFVLLIGDLGSYHTNVGEEVFRGFAIADEIAPFIVINHQDAQTARLFTLIHELVHIFVGSSGVSATPPVTEVPKSSTETTERFCMMW